MKSFLVESFCLLVGLLAGRFGRAEMSPLSLIKSSGRISFNYFIMLDLPIKSLSKYIC